MLVYKKLGGPGKVRTPPPRPSEKVDPINNFKRLALARMEGHSVEAMSGSFLSKFCVENWGDYSLGSSRGGKRFKTNGLRPWSSK